MEVQQPAEAEADLAATHHAPLPPTHTDTHTAAATADDDSVTAAAAPVPAAPPLSSVVPVASLSLAGVAPSSPLLSATSASPRMLAMGSRSVYRPRAAALSSMQMSAHAILSGSADAVLAAAPLAHVAASPFAAAAAEALAAAAASARAIVTAPHIPDADIAGEGAYAQIGTSEPDCAASSAGGGGSSDECASGSDDGVALQLPVLSAIDKSTSAPPSRRPSQPPTFFLNDALSSSHVDSAGHVHADAPCPPSADTTPFIATLSPDHPMPGVLSATNANRSLRTSPTAAPLSTSPDGGPHGPPPPPMVLPPPSRVTVVRTRQLPSQGFVFQSQADGSDRRHPYLGPPTLHHVGHSRAAQLIAAARGFATGQAILLQAQQALHAQQQQQRQSSRSHSYSGQNTPPRPDDAASPPVAATAASSSGHGARVQFDSNILDTHDRALSARSSPISARPSMPLGATKPPTAASRNPFERARGVSSSAAAAQATLRPSSQAEHRDSDVQMVPLLSSSSGSQQQQQQQPQPTPQKQVRSSRRLHLESVLRGQVQQHGPGRPALLATGSFSPVDHDEATEAGGMRRVSSMPSLAAAAEAADRQLRPLQPLQPHAAFSDAAASAAPAPQAGTSASSRWSTGSNNDDQQRTQQQRSADDETDDDSSHMHIRVHLDHNEAAAAAAAASAGALVDAALGTRAGPWTDGSSHFTGAQYHSDPPAAANRDSTPSVSTVGGGGVQGPRCSRWPWRVPKFCWQLYYLLLFLHQCTSGTMAWTADLPSSLGCGPWSGALLSFVDAYFRGWGQVVFQNNPLTGALIAAAMLIQDRWVGLMGVWACVAATAFAKALGLNPGAYQAGLFGYNSVLVGLALGTFDAVAMGPWSPAILGPVTVLSAFSVLVTVALSNVLAGKWGVPPLTLPFNLCAIMYLTGGVTMQYFPVPFQAGHMQDAVPVRAPDPLPVDAELFFRAVPIGVGQVFLADKLAPGVLTLLAIGVCSPCSAVFALLGSLVGELTALAMGIAPAGIYAGLWGYNSVLGAIALGGFFYLPNATSSFMAVLCALLCSMLQASCSVLFSAWGGFPTLTFPFCLITLAFLLLQSSVPQGLIPIPLAILTYPEEHLHRYRVHTNFLTQLRATADLLARRDQYEKTQRAKEAGEREQAALALLNINQKPSKKAAAAAMAAAAADVARQAAQARTAAARKGAVAPSASGSAPGGTASAGPSEPAPTSLYPLTSMSLSDLSRRAARISSLLDSFFDLLDPDGVSDAVSFGAVRASLNSVLGTVHSDANLSVEQLAKMLIDFTRDDEERDRERAAALQIAYASLQAALESEDADAVAAAVSACDEAADGAATADLSDLALFLSLDPFDVFIEYDDLYQFFMAHRRIDWKAQFMNATATTATTAAAAAATADEQSAAAAMAGVSAPLLANMV